MYGLSKILSDVDQFPRTKDVSNMLLILLPSFISRTILSVYPIGKVSSINTCVGLIATKGHTFFCFFMAVLTTLAELNSLGRRRVSVSYCCAVVRGNEKIM